MSGNIDEQKFLRNLEELCEVRNSDVQIKFKTNVIIVSINILHFSYIRNQKPKWKL